MSLFECKMCGGALEFTEGAAVAKCKYCGTAQTLPKTVDEIMQNLFVRANALRLKNEFDKAEKIYERIIQNDPTQSEAYWGLILCKYGIEYVDDPETKQKIPTCHRASYDSIIADDDFRLALEYADEEQRAVLEEQAREIDRIQKEILALAQKEETYDVFICYKETDENGKRTRDSVIANDIYYQLKQEGFKVFYAAITLENKLGSAYEPIIFAALHSARVMLAVGTKPEYFNAVWVKNEWSRYLKIIKQDRTKLLIPCYRDMDAYELPDEFAHLQAQDMAKIGFITDLVRGVRKVVRRDAPKTSTPTKETAPAAPAAAAPANTAPLLKRAFLFLEDEEWEHADEYFERVLDQDPENASAYVGKMMIEFRVRRQEDLAELPEPFDKNNYYKKAIRFAAPILKATLTGYIDKIHERKENERLEGLYLQACALKENARDEASCRAAADAFRPIQQYKDSAQLLKECLEAAENTQKIAILAEAQEKIDRNTISDYAAAIALLRTIAGWRDVDSLIVKCEETLETLRQEAEARRLEQERLEEERRKKAAANAKRAKKVALIATPIVCFVVVVAVLLNTVIMPAIVNAPEKKPAETTGEQVLEQPAVEETVPAPATTETTSTTEATETYSEGLAYTISQNAVTITGIGTCTDKEISIPAEINGLPVTSIGIDAFRDCSSLASVSLPEGITSIGGLAFDGCKSLTSISIPKSVTRIAVGAFQSCKNLTSISIPEGVTRIEQAVFHGCSNLTSVSIPEGVTSIERTAFYNCNNLASVSIPEGVTSIGENAFYNCIRLKEITYGGTVEQWKNIQIETDNDPLLNATIHCADGDISQNSTTTYSEGLEYMVYGITVIITGIGTYKDTELQIPSTIDGLPVMQIAPSAFLNCTFIKSVFIPEGVISIGDYAFRGCSNLKSITIPNGITSIGDHVFDSCDSLTNIVLPEGVSSIGNSVFAGCSSLTSITLPKSVKIMGNHVFDGCSSLISITLPKGIVSMGYDVFAGCSSLTSITLPEGMTRIEHFTFFNCSNLKNVIIPDSMTYIDFSVFNRCSNLESIVIPNGVTSIEDATFYLCSNLTSISIPVSVTSIGAHAFYGCSSLTSVSIPASVTSIGEYAFYGCSSLTSISIPVSVTSIGANAFYGCSILKEITYGGTVEQWKNIQIETDNDPLLNTTIHCTDGDIIPQ